jgi:CHASE3 domain sensor protein
VPSIWTAYDVREEIRVCTPLQLVFVRCFLMNAARMTRLISPFPIALILLCLSGVAATVTIIRLYDSEALVNHTYTVEVSVGDLESTLAQVGRNRVAYVESGTGEALENFKASVAKVGPALDRIRRLTSDNPAEQVLCDRLDSNANQRIATSIESVELRQHGLSDPVKQFDITFRSRSGRTRINCWRAEVTFHDSFS